MKNITRRLLTSGAVCLAFPAYSQALAQEGEQQSRVAADASSTDSVKRQRRNIEEVVVTAQKRLENLQDVPVAISVVGAPDLVTTNNLRIQDYYDRVPGLNFTSRNQSGVVLSIRGIQAGAINSPTVGILIDDVPFVGATSQIVPDFDPGDLARVEVLRGPQGTLYGASSMGGLLKYVTSDPSTEEWSGAVNAGASSVKSADDLGYNFRGSLNAPISDSFAIRASAFTRREPGYVDDPSRGMKDVNEVNSQGGRLSALLRLSETFSIKLSAMLQRMEGDGSSKVSRLPGLGDLEQSNLLRDAGTFERKVQAYSAAVHGNIGVAEVTWLSGYNVNQAHDFLDFSYPGGFGGVAQALFGVPGAASITDIENKKFTQEIRMNVPLGSRIEWMLGGFYTHEDLETLQFIPAIAPTTNAIAGNIISTQVPGTFEEYAPFTNLTFKISDRFDVQAGVRKSWIKQSNGPTRSSGSLAAAPVSPETKTSEDAFTYLLTPRYRVSPDLMVYARMASGYRPGGGGSSGSQAFCVVNNIPCDFSHDEVRNYELGAKGELQNFLYYDVSLFYIDWTDIQVQLNIPGTPLNFISNAGNAKSQGAELTLELNPISSQTIKASLAYTDAELADPFPANSTTYGAAGDRLPFSSRFSGNLSIDQEFSLTSELTGSVGASVTYVGDRKGIFRPTSAPTRQDYPSYVKTDARLGLIYQQWRADFFANNITDRRGVLSGGLGAAPPTDFTYIQPRTFGVSLTRDF